MPSDTRSAERGKHHHARMKVGIAAGDPIALEYRRLKNISSPYYTDPLKKLEKRAQQLKAEAGDEEARAWLKERGLCKLDLRRWDRERRIEKAKALAARKRDAETALLDDVRGVDGSKDNRGTRQQASAPEIDVILIEDDSDEEGAALANTEVKHEQAEIVYVADEGDVEEEGEAASAVPNGATAARAVLSGQASGGRDWGGREDADDVKDVQLQLKVAQLELELHRLQKKRP